MKIKGEYVLTEVGNEKIAVPVGEAGEAFRGIVKLNDTGAFIWKDLSEGKTAEDISKEIVKEYADVTYEEALESVVNIIEKIKAEGVLED